MRLELVVIFADMRFFALWFRYRRQRKKKGEGGEGREERFPVRFAVWGSEIVMK